MHRSVLKNDDYMDFADANTVEVIALGRLDEAIEKEDEKAATYEVEVNGEKVEYLVEWPGLTVADINALKSSKAGQYNKSGGIPYISIVDPHTEEEIVNSGEWTARTAKTIMEAATAALETLQEEHGKGMKRKDLRKVDDAEGDAAKAISKKDFAKAIKAVEKIAKKGKDWPEGMQERFKAMQEHVANAASEALDEIEALDDAKEAKRLLGRFKNKLKGTGHEDRAKALYAKLSEKK